MRKDEATFHANLVKWMKYNLHHLPDNYIFETKVARLGHKSFPLKELSEKERHFLRQAAEKGIIVTNSDYGGMGTICDGYRLHGHGLIFLQFVRRANKKFYMFDIFNLEQWERDYGYKSINEENVKTIFNYKEFELK